MNRPTPRAVIEALSLKFVLTRAADLTNDPGKARDIIERWHDAATHRLRRRDRGVFALLAEDAVGILLAAHAAQPEAFDAADAVNLAMLSTSRAGGPLRPASVAAARWSIVMSTHP